MSAAVADLFPHETDQARLAVRRRRLIFLALLPALLAALALWLGSEYRRLGSTEEEAQRVHARQLLFSELFSSIKDAETGQRGFVITGDDTFLEPYRLGRNEVRSQWAALREMPANATERQRLDRFGPLVRAKFDEMERVIAARRVGGLVAAAAQVSEGRGKRLMDQIRDEAASARAAEAAILSRTLERQDERTRFTSLVIWVVVLALTVAFLIFGLFVWRADREREALELVAREAAARRRAIFDSTLDAIVLINPSGSIETINRAATHLFGYDSEALIRRDISLVVDLAPGEAPFLDRIGLNGDQLIDPFRSGLVARRADGSSVPVEAALGTMPLPDGMHIVAAFRDVSEREKAERIKDQFLSTVSHELRTPLTSIVGSLGLLRAGTSEELSPGVQRLVVIAENNANRLIRLVNDLLDIEKFESGEMSFDFAPMDLREAAGKALDAVRGIADERGVTLDLEQPAEPVMVRGDSDRLIQVMTNLLANAARFTPSGKKVTLAVTRRASHAEASVIDEGPGIDEELRGRLFTRFAQSIQAPAGTSRGTGLGLAISREIVRNHGGGIWYDPGPSGGSVFSFNLPLWNMVTHQPDNRAAPRVLISASDGEARRIASALENRSIRADVISDTEAMLAALREGRYLTLLLDCHSLASDTSLLRRIRNEASSRALPIIAISAGDDHNPADFGLLDVVDWIPRPLDSGRLNEAIASVIARATVEMPLILHVDDDTDTLEITATALEGRARMARATDLASARAFIADQHPDVVIIDLALPDGCGEELVADLAQSGDLATPLIIYSAQERNGEFAREVSAVLTKSRRSLSALVETITEILDKQSGAGVEGGR
jgi:PAS domain S-box-containing protein